MTLLRTFAHHLAAFALLVFLTSHGTQAAEITIPSLDGKLQIPGLWLAAEGNERRPAVIALHGCGGAMESGHFKGHYVHEAAYFNAENMHFLAVEQLPGARADGYLQHSRCAPHNL
ncbi:MAG: hypothetical protein QM776_03685 [Rhodocyclaceae bacterium]